jgi:hypothetical protein
MYLSPALVRHAAGVTWVPLHARNNVRTVGKHVFLALHQSSSILRMPEPAHDFACLQGLQPIPSDVVAGVVAQSCGSSYKKCSDSSCKTRYHRDPAFRARELARTAEKVQTNYAKYQELWRQAYLRRKAARHQVQCKETFSP